MSQTREDVFDELLVAMDAADPLESLLSRAVRIGARRVGGDASGLGAVAGVVVNEQGEVLRSVGAAPARAIAEWAMTTGPGAAEGDGVGDRGCAVTTVGLWVVRGRVVRIRQRRHTIVLAVRSHRRGVSAPDGAADAEFIELIIDTIVKLLRAFEGFESFSISTRKEESARLLRALEAGISPGREPALWRQLESFGFTPYQPVRMVRARLLSSTEAMHAPHIPHTSQPSRTPHSSQSPRTPHTSQPPRRRSSASRADPARPPAEPVASRAPAESGVGGSPAHEAGIVVNDSGYTASAIELTAVCVAEFPVADHFSYAPVSGIGVSEAFTALSQTPEMLRTADVALAAAEPGALVAVDDMRPVEWAAARMGSRSDRQLISRFLARLSVGSESWSTLTAYIESGASIAEAARRLSVHENTVRYRLGQIERILGARLSDPRAAADVVLALEVHRLSGK